MGYEWGAPHWEGYASPDDAAQESIGAAYSRYAGGWRGTPPYVYGNMNELVYAVNGGMEDWAYAASWDPDRVVACQPTTHGGYDKQKLSTTTRHSERSTCSLKRAIMESPDHISVRLGMYWTFGSGGSNGDNGHISRNIRLALLAAELVEPYVSIATVHGLALRDDIIPLREPNDNPRSCQNTRGVRVPSSTTTITVEWRVGGALTIDNTQLWYAKWKDIPARLLHCQSQPHSADDLKDLMNVGTPLSATSGRTIFADGSKPRFFKAQVDLSPFHVHDQIVILALATVDQDWMEQPNDVAPAVPPQSHIVNARTNKDWYHETEGGIIQGRRQWFSLPLTIVKTPTKKVAPILDRFPLEAETADYSHINDHHAPSSPSRPSDAWQPTPTATTGGSNFLSAVGILLVVAVLVFVARSARQRQARAANRSRVRELIQDESAVSPGSRGGKETEYSDHVEDDEDIGEVEMGRYAD